MSFSVGTARNYIDDLHQDQAQLLQADPSLPANHRYFKLKFNKTIENSLDVMKIFCLLFCGPVLLVECIVTMINHRSIVQSCEAFYDPFTNVIVYFLIVVTVVSVGFLTVLIIGLIMCYRVIKQNWQEIRNYRGNNNNNRSDSNQDSVILQNEQLLNYIDNEDEDDDEEIDLFQQSINNRRASRASQIIGQQQRFQQNYEQYEYAIDYPDDSDSDDDDHYQQDNYDQDGYGDENDNNDEEQNYGQSSSGLAEYVNDSFDDDYRNNDQQNNYDDNENENQDQSNNQNNNQNQFYSRIN
eukprot:403339295